MAFNIWALTIVKTLGMGYPAVQIVFLRAVMGLLIMLPWMWVARARFRNLTDVPLHALRVILAT